MTIPKGLLALNGVLAIASVFFATEIWRSLVEPRPAPGVGPRQAVRAASKDATRPPAETLSEPHPPLMSYALIPAKNVFSPTRTEGPPVAAAVPAGPKPFLYGVVMRDDLSIAYLEDPASKRVAGYRIGDAIAGGTVEAIGRDHIVLKRSDGAVDVQLRDPLKPRPAPAESAAAAPPGTLPAGTPPPPAGAAGIIRQPQPPMPGASPAPPALLRRLPAPPTLPVPPPGPYAPSR